MVNHIQTSIYSKFIIEVGGCEGLSNSDIEIRIEKFTKLVTDSTVFNMNNVLILPSRVYKSSITIVEYT